MAAEVLGEFALTEESLARKVTRKLAGYLDGRGDPTSIHVAMARLHGSAKMLLCGRVWRPSNRTRAPSHRRPGSPPQSHSWRQATPGSNKVRLFRMVLRTCPSAARIPTGCAHPVPGLVH